MNFSVVIKNNDIVINDIQNIHNRFRVLFSNFKETENVYNFDSQQWKEFTQELQTNKTNISNEFLDIVNKILNLVKYYTKVEQLN